MSPWVGPSLATACVSDLRSAEAAVPRIGPLRLAATAMQDGNDRETSIKPVKRASFERALKTDCSRSLASVG